MANGDFRETAFLICRTKDGRHVAGKTITGTRHEVDIPPNSTCQVGSTPVGVSHTHPPESSIRPSKPDIIETRNRGLGFVCVGWQGEHRCYLV